MSTVPTQNYALFDNNTPLAFLQKFLAEVYNPPQDLPAYADKCGLKKHRKIFTADDGRLYLA